jgi:hypothetical protein
MIRAQRELAGRWQALDGGRDCRLDELLDAW